MLLTSYLPLRHLLNFFGRITSFFDLECHKQCFDLSCAISDIFQSIMDKVTKSLDLMRIISSVSWHLLCDYFPVTILIMIPLVYDKYSLLTYDLIWFEESKDCLTSLDQETFLEPTWNIVKGLFSSM